MELSFNGKQVTEKQMAQLMAEADSAIIAEEIQIMDFYGVTAETASAISYLRTRSRWSEEMELELVSRDKSGDPIPLGDVLSGEF